AVFTEEVEAHAVTFSFLDVIIETVAQDKILRTGEVAFEDTILHPLAKALQDAMDATTTFIIFNVVGHHNAHRLTWSWMGDSRQFRPLALWPGGELVVQNNAGRRLYTRRLGAESQCFCAPHTASGICDALPP